MADGNSPQRIHKLPDSLVNRIAAGEVIERPASVVKELLENSLDAGATKITLEVNGGGSRLIRLNDNGHGIHPDDLLLAVDRHATSKLDKDSDLFKIATLGFRGEALSSIAAVSRLNLVSRQEDSSHGWSVNFDSSPLPQPAAHPVGTTVEVRDLFYKTPARRKFLRTEKTEFIHIQELVKRIALSRFNLAVRFMQNNRQVMLLSDDTNNPAQRINSILGKQFLNNSLMLEQRLDNMLLYGWAASPEIARSQADQQYFYLNGRIIKDKLINHAVRMAYEDLLYPGRYPAYVLYLEMDHAEADINVHPTKHEVRFRHARDVHDFIYGSLSGLLNGQHTRSQLHEHSNITVMTGNKSHLMETASVNEPEFIYGKTQTGLSVVPEQYPYGIPIAQIKGRFLIAETPAGIILHDIFRMRELVSWVRLKQEYETGTIKSRPILVPLKLAVDDNASDLIENHKVLLEKTGLLLQQISHNSIQIRTLPVMLPYADALSLVKDVISLFENKKISEVKPGDVILVLTQHANDIAPVKLDIRDMNLLLMDFFESKDRINDTQFMSAMKPFNLGALQDLIDGKN